MMKTNPGKVSTSGEVRSPRARILCFQIQGLETVRGGGEIGAKIIGSASCEVWTCLPEVVGIDQGLTWKSEEDCLSG